MTQRLCPWCMCRYEDHADREHALDCLEGFADWHDRHDNVQTKSLLPDLPDFESVLRVGTGKLTKRKRLLIEAACWATFWTVSMTLMATILVATIRAMNVESTVATTIVLGSWVAFFVAYLRDQKEKRENDL